MREVDKHHTQHCPLPVELLPQTSSLSKEKSSFPVDRVNGPCEPWAFSDFSGQCEGQGIATVVG